MGEVLFGFDPVKVASRGWDADLLLDQIVERLHPVGQVRRGSRSLWPRFCRAVVDGAEFLAQFESADEFNEWVKLFDNDDRTRPALPMLLSYEIDGLGFALACDFLKELGYVDFGKPDVHLKEIFSALGLSRSKGDYDVFKAIVRVARHAGVTCYHVDKLFWLIGSGNFYLDGVTVGRQRTDFIEYARQQQE